MKPIELILFLLGSAEFCSVWGKTADEIASSTTLSPNVAVNLIDGSDLSAKKRKRVILDPSRLIKCPNIEGTFPLPEKMNMDDLNSIVKPRRCHDQFLMCKYLDVGMRGFIFRCPSGFVYSQYGARCQMKETVPECNNNNNPVQRDRFKRFHRIRHPYRH